MKRSGAIKRTTALKRRASVKAVNTKRKATAFAHAYHSKERVAFIKELPCVVCASIFGPFTPAVPSDNAHTGKAPGKGLKAHYSAIVPLCRNHHRRYDEHRAPFDISGNRAALPEWAALVERKWVGSQR